jgi:hypothetical protein
MKHAYIKVTSEDSVEATLDDYSKQGFELVSAVNNRTTINEPFSLLLFFKFVKQDTPFKGTA